MITSQIVLGPLETTGITNLTNDGPIGDRWPNLLPATLAHLRPSVVSLVRNASTHMQAYVGFIETVAAICQQREWADSRAS
jgi:hypothetical protein